MKTRAILVLMLGALLSSCDAPFSAPNNAWNAYRQACKPESVQYQVLYINEGYIFVARCDPVRAAPDAHPKPADKDETRL